MMNEGSLGWWLKSLVSTLTNVIECTKADVNVTPNINLVSHVNFETLLNNAGGGVIKKIKSFPIVQVF
jgi:hypothetical protein